MDITNDDHQLAGAWLGNAPRYSCAGIATLVTVADSWGLGWNRAGHAIRKSQKILGEICCQMRIKV
jgi:hypothetical protein